MDIQEFAKQLSDATKDMSEEQRANVRAMFTKVADQLDRPLDSTVAHTECTEVPNGPTERHVRLKQNFLKQVPSITTFRARAVTEFTRKNPGMPKIELRAKCFRYCCETAPLIIQERRGFSSATPRVLRARRRLLARYRLALAARRARHHWHARSRTPSTSAGRGQEVHARRSYFPFWEGKSLDEVCEDQYRECGGWEELSGESFVSDCSYHQVNGGGDSNPGYDVILMKKGMQDIQDEAREHLRHLDYANPDDMDKIYFYKSVIDTTEGVMIYARRLSDFACQKAQECSDPKRRARSFCRSAKTSRTCLPTSRAPSGRPCSPYGLSRACCRWRRTRPVCPSAALTSICIPSTRPTKRLAA